MLQRSDNCPDSVCVLPTDRDLSVLPRVWAQNPGPDRISAGAIVSFPYFFVLLSQKDPVSQAEFHSCLALALFALSLHKLAS